MDVDLRTGHPAATLGLDWLEKRATRSSTLDKVLDKLRLSIDHPSQAREAVFCAHLVEVCLEAVEELAESHALISCKMQACWFMDDENTT